MRTPSGIATLLVPALLAAGCGGGKGSVEGELTVSGKPVTSGDRQE
jgi:hypothetical protein